jgi:hypothetical protein
MNGDVVLPVERIDSIILLVRGQKVILDRDLAQLYGVTTGNLNKAVKRNIDRFPNDFMFQLTPEEYESLRFRFGIFKKGQHSKYLPRQSMNVKRYKVQMEVEGPLSFFTRRDSFTLLTRKTKLEPV